MKIKATGHRKWNNKSNVDIKKEILNVNIESITVDWIQTESFFNKYDSYCMRDKVVKSGVVYGAVEV